MSHPSFFKSMKHSIHSSSLPRSKPAAINGTNRDRPKTAEELFMEHKEAARRWSQGQKREEHHFKPENQSIDLYSNDLVDESHEEDEVSESIASPPSLNAMFSGPFSSPVGASCHLTVPDSPLPSSVQSEEEVTSLPAPQVILHETIPAVPDGDVIGSPAVPRVEASLRDRLNYIATASFLSANERKGLLAILLLTPALLYGWEVLFLPSTRPEEVPHAPLEASSGLIVQYRTMTRFDVVVSVILGVLLSAMMDADTAATDQRVRQWIVRAGGALGVRIDPASSSAQATAASAVAATMGGATSAWLPTSPFSRLVLVALVLGYGLKVAASSLVTAAVQVTVRYGPLLAGLLCLVAVMYGAGALGLWYVRRRSLRTHVVAALAAMTKGLLVTKGRAYPISYLFEEVKDAVKLAQLGVGSPAVAVVARAQPAVVIGSAGGFLGESSSTETPSWATAAGVVAEAEVVGVTAEGDGAAEDSVRERRREDILQGHSLRQLWGEVQRAVQADSRVQKLDLLVDGKKQACWRVLAANTSARI